MATDTKQEQQNLRRKERIALTFRLSSEWIQNAESALE